MATALLPKEQRFSGAPKDNGMDFTVEVDIPSQAVGKLTGVGWKIQLKKETGAYMRLYTQTKQDEYPFVRLRGSADQVESAFECVCDEVAKVDIRFARRMLARSALVAESRQVGWIKGTNGVKLEKLEKDTNAKVRVEPFTKEKETQDITITGTVMEVYAAYAKIQESLESYDPEKAKKAIRVPSHGAPKEADVTHTKHSSELMQCKLTIKARPLLFACLLGKAQENIKKIRESTSADIEIGTTDSQREFQDIHIEGDVLDVIKATRTVKASLEWFDPNHPSSKQKMKKESVNIEELKQMTGHASLTMLNDMAGYYAGKKFANINKIRDETKVDRLAFADHEDNQCKLVEIVGDLECVIDAVDRSAIWLKRFVPSTARSIQHQPVFTKNASDQGQLARSHDDAPNKRARSKKGKKAKTFQQQTLPPSPRPNPQVADQAPVVSQMAASRVVHSVEVATMLSESSTGAQAMHLLPSAQMLQPQQVHIQTPGQQHVQSTNVPPSYIMLQPISASGQQQIPLQQGHVLQAVPNVLQQPQQVLPQAAHVQIVPGVSGQALVFDQRPLAPTQMAYLSAVPVSSQENQRQSQINVTIQHPPNAIP